MNNDNASVDGLQTNYQIDKHTYRLINCPAPPPSPVLID